VCHVDSVLTSSSDPDTAAINFFEVSSSTKLTRSSEKARPTVKKEITVRKSRTLATETLEGRVVEDGHGRVALVNGKPDRQCLKLAVDRVSGFQDLMLLIRLQVRLL